jgi:hypothetical protein
VLKLIIHPDAEADMVALRVSDLGSWAVLTVYLEELQGDPDELDRLSQHGYNFEGGHWTQNVDVKLFVEQQREGRNLWRLKLWELEREGYRYRLLYAFLPRRQEYVLLAVVDRNTFNYESSHPVTQRVVEAYRNLPR